MLLPLMRPKLLPTPTPKLDSPTPQLPTALVELQHYKYTRSQTAASPRRFPLVAGLPEAVRQQRSIVATNTARLLHRVRAGVSASLSTVRGVAWCVMRGA